MNPIPFLFIILLFILLVNSTPIGFMQMFSLYPPWNEIGIPLNIGTVPDSGDYCAPLIWEVCE